jgi:ribosomal protein S18 acetylase RimI-like enzyme
LTAAVSTSSPPRGHGLRPFNARRDMGALADLIETAFAQQLDSAGRQMVAGMRILSRLGWLGWLLSRWLLPPAANPIGYVWEEEGRVVGNASLMPVRNYERRWVIANVAVQEGFRRRGIAGQLVEAAIAAARERAARQVILQVDRENQAARDLYHRYGFQTLADRTTWVRPHGLAPMPAVDTAHARPREPGEWHEQLALARRLHPEGLIWPFPTVASLFRPRAMAGWPALNPQSHWVWRTEGRIQGSLSLRPGIEPGLQRLVLVVEPAFRDQAEGALLDCVLEKPVSRRMAYVLDYETGCGETILRERGFEPRRGLLWMGLDLAPQEAIRESSA